MITCLGTNTQHSRFDRQEKGLASGIYCLSSLFPPFFFFGVGGMGGRDPWILWGILVAIWRGLARWDLRREERRGETWEEGNEEIFYFFKLIMIMNQKLHRSFARYPKF